MWRLRAALLLAVPIGAWAQDGLKEVPELDRRLSFADIAHGFGTDTAAVLPNTSSDVMSGLVEAFLHKEQMPEEEKQCLINGTSEIAGNIMTVASHTVMLIQAVMGIRSVPPPPLPRPSAEGEGQLSKADQAEELRKSGALVERRRLQGGALGVALGASQLFIDLGVSLQKIALLSHKISKDCIRGEAREALHRASEHMRNVQYIGGHFLANGADIVSEIGDGVDNWNSGNYKEFGHCIGIALRKAVLSNTTSNANLPEGPADKQVLGNITVGLADGLLGKGFTLEVDMLGRPEANLHINLRECVGQNLYFFQSAWSATMLFFAQQAAEVKHDPRKFKLVKKKFGSQIAFTMMQLPRALKTCNINQVQEAAILDAVKAFGTGMSFQFRVPGGQHFGLPLVEAKMKEAVEHWKACKWYSFGHDIGKLLQLMVLTIFPQKYSVSADGSLQQQLAEEVMDSPDSKEEITSGSEVFIAVPAIVLLMVALGISAARRTLMLARLAAAPLPQRPENSPRQQRHPMAAAAPAGVDVESAAAVAGIE